MKRKLSPDENRIPPQLLRRIVHILQESAAQKRFVAYAALLLCALLIAAFLLWLKGRNLPFACIAAGALSVLLFCAALLRSAGPLEKAWRIGGKEEQTQQDDSTERNLVDAKKNVGAHSVGAHSVGAHSVIRLGFAVLGFVLVLNFFIVMLAFEKSGHYRLAESLEIFWHSTNIDANHYLEIAEGWYQNTANDLRLNIVFFPLYPLFIRAIAALGIPTVLSAIFVSGAFTVGSGMLLYKLARLDYNCETSQRAVKYLLLFPASFFLVAPMSESVFLFFTLCTFYTMRQRRWLVAALYAFLASLTRSTGVVLVVPIAIEMVAQIRSEHVDGSRGILRMPRMLRIRSLSKWMPVALLAPLAALLVYLGLNYSVYGNALEFMRIQKEHWSQQITVFWNTPIYQLQYFMEWLKSFDVSGAFGLMGVGLLTFFVALCILCGGAPKARAAYMGYALVYFGMTMGANWLLSAPRYMLCLFPLFLILAHKAKDPLWDSAISVISSVLFGCLLYMFLVGYYVF